METHSSDKRIQFLKEDGTDLFTEGDIVGATDMYITALQLEMDQSLQAVISGNTTSSDENSDNKIQNPFLERETKQTVGINRVLDAVLEDADKAIKVNPTLPKAYLAKATALILYNKWEEAREVYAKGIKTCENCPELRQAFQKFHQTQVLLRSIPVVLEKTRSASVDTLSESDGRSSPSSKSKRFRLQHRKKLSRPKTDIVMSTNPEMFKSKIEKQTDRQEMAVSSSTATTTESNDSSSDSSWV